VRLPHSEQAIVEPEKVHDYLVSTSHPVGRFKATFFAALGYSVENWPQLRDAFLEIARSPDFKPGQQSPFGQKFPPRATLLGPSGRHALVVTVWIVPNGETAPRFVTAFPG